MSGSRSFRIPVLVGLFLALSGLGVYLAFRSEPQQLGRLEVFPPPAEGAQGTSGTLENPAIEGTEPGPTAAQIEVVIETVARTLRDRNPKPECALITSPETKPDEQGIAGTFVAGLAASPLARDCRGLQLVHFRLPDGRDHYRLTRLQPQEPERILLTHGMPSMTRGKVVNATGRPIDGARVWIAGEQTTTDPQGEYRVPAIPIDSGLPMVVTKAGYAASFRSLSRTQYETLAERPVILQAGVELAVDLQGKEDATVFLLPAGGRDSRLLAYPFFLQAIERTYRLRSGFAVFESLPRGARVRVMVSHPDVAPFVSGEIRLDRPEVAATVALRVLPTIRGKVVDAMGRPIEAASITVRAGDRGVSLGDVDWLLPPEAYVRDAAFAVTSGTTQPGGFAVPGLASPTTPAGRAGSAARTLLTVEADGYVGLEYALTESPKTDLQVTLWSSGGGAAAGEPRLLLTRGDSLPERVALTVRDENGSHGPYTWKTSVPFPLRLSRRSVVRVQLRVDNREPTTRSVLVTGDTVLAVPK